MTAGKKCRTCSQVKPLDSFYVARSNRDGLVTECKSCVSVRSRWYRMRNRERLRASDKAREGTPTRRQQHWRNTYRQRAERFGLTPVYGTGDQQVTHAAVVARYGEACHYSYDNICEGGFTVLDHYLPVSFGGAHTLENVRPACRPCNTDRYYRGLRWIDPDAAA